MACGGPGSAEESRLSFGFMPRLDQILEVALSLILQESAQQETLALPRPQIQLLHPTSIPCCLVCPNQKLVIEQKTASQSLVIHNRDSSKPCPRLPQQPQNAPPVLPGSHSGSAEYAVTAAGRDEFPHSKQSVSAVLAFRNVNEHCQSPGVGVNTVVPISLEDLQSTS